MNIMEKLGVLVLHRPEAPHGATRMESPNTELNEIGEILATTQLSETARASSGQLERSEIAHTQVETDVKYQFRSISLPDSKQGLTRILLAIRGTRHFYQAAEKLSIWTNTLYNSLFTDPEILFASLSFRAYFVGRSGQINQELSCVTASILSMELLVGILTGVDKRQFREDGITPTLLLPQTIEPFRNISPPDLKRAAIHDRRLHLHVFKKVAGFNNWVQDVGKTRILETFWAVADGQILVFWRCPHQICSSVKRTTFYAVYYTVPGSNI
ncbi:hypothetical protein BDV41DRAFT_580014 [Aspergillus transmontanensis]|uniref:Uncharacterized protein n=1 Tax=Aspergillus transmontanensis TaxID=1034304 RepID=A0A5N6VNY5_9EURO|nr:hypothetical protein BDV41DRAFT_580014 [Aspergillus transmontanensis]